MRGRGYGRRFHLWRGTALVAMALLVGAPAARGDDAEVGEEERLSAMALDLMIAGQSQIMVVADPIRIAAAPWCKRKVVPVLGVYAPDEFSLRDLYRDLGVLEPFLAAADTRFDLRKTPRVLALVPGLPAAEAGLQVGDLVTAIDGKESKRRIFLDQLRTGAEARPVQIRVERDGATREVRVDAQLGCEYVSRLAFGTAINAYATSFGALTGMYFYTGMLRFLPDDDDLAVVVGHELAHLVLGHTRTLEQYEADADYLGLYFAARAGFDVSKAPDLWDRMARRNPYSSIDTGFYTHPLSARRSLALRATLDEIAAHRAAGTPLEPGKNRPHAPEVEEDAVEAHVESLREDALVLLRSRQKRIQDVSYRLALAGASECADDSAPILGATLARRQDFGRHKSDEVAAAFGVGDDVTVLAVAEASPAQRAGLRVGDRIEKVNGSRIRRTTHVFDRLRSSREGDPVFRIERDDEDIELALPRELGCPYGTLVFIGGTDTDHHGNRHEVAVPTGLLDFVRDDDELALAIAHQMAHSIHGRFRDVEDEPPADTLAVRIASRAGFDVTKAPDFWDRWGAEQFWKISTDRSNVDHIPHGAMSLRAPAIRTAVSDAAANVEPAELGSMND